jgi:ATP-dependent Zn protease
VNFPDIIGREEILKVHMKKLKVGDDVDVKLWHKGETKDIRVRLEERQ